ALKLQFRDLDTFIHPAYKTRADVKHIPRFLSTKLSKQEFRELVAETRRAGLITMATPFDEVSVETFRELGIEVAKVASCSAEDWPLLEKIAGLGKPVIVSVGGLPMRDVDRIVSFFEHKGVHFALMHCVAIYPTPPEKMYLHQIEVMRERYPHLVIGFSTHEAPTDTATIGLAYAKGARIFEKHVGVPTEKIKLNAYSANPEELHAWLSAYKRAVLSCADTVSERPADPAETADLASLKRGVFAKRRIGKGQTISVDDVFYAMPIAGPEHLTSGRFRQGSVADKDYEVGEAVSAKVLPTHIEKKHIIYAAVREAKAMLNKAKIALSHDFTVEVSHHHGLEAFHKVGCIIIDCINREYAKKLIIQFSGQFHPVHYHKTKDESFHVLSGTLEADVEGRKKVLYPGDTLWIPRGVWHSFRTESGVIFEEISTTALDANGDSFYIDRAIAAKPREARKTKLMNWGRHQFD
ncbi:MAG: N-acetylneuraminate synthase, partial [Parcubacteria group bacterium Gr01-1014_72]